jgi:hypothetical protein
MKNPRWVFCARLRVTEDINFIPRKKQGSLKAARHDKNEIPEAKLLIFSSFLH